MTTAAPALTKLDLPRIALMHPEGLAPLTKIDGPDGPEQFRLWPHQVGIIRAVLSSPKVIVLKARQLGVTWVMALIALWWAIAHPGQTVLVVSIGEREAMDVLRRVRRLYDSLPLAVQQAFPLGSATATRLEVAHPDGPSVILSLPSSSTAGRGQTVHLLIGDERPAWPHADEQEAALLPAAADSGRVIMVGTANGFDGFRERFMGAPANGWQAIFVDALARPGRTAAWVERERMALGDTGAQEFPLSAAEAFLASGRCVFDTRALQGLLDTFTGPPKGRYDLRHQDAIVVADPALEGRWQVWEWPRAGRRYIIAADVCGGGGGEDYAYATVHDADSWDQVAALHGRPDPGVLSAEIAKAGWLYSGDRGPALLVPEANNHGQAVVALLSEWGYPRIYTREAFDRRGSAPAPSSLLGWLTTGKSREVAIAALQDAIRDQEAGIRDAAAIGECLAFVDKDGRVEAAEGSHDDRVMALAIAYAVLARSRAGRRVEQAPQAPYVPRVSSLTGYSPKFTRGFMA